MNQVEGFTQNASIMHAAAACAGAVFLWRFGGGKGGAEVAGDAREQCCWLLDLTATGGRQVRARHMLHTRMCLLRRWSSERADRPVHVALWPPLPVRFVCMQLATGLIGHVAAIPSVTQSPSEVPPRSLCMSQDWQEASQWPGASGPVEDPVCALCMRAAVLLVARASGELLRYSLPDRERTGRAQKRFVNRRITS